MISIIFVEPESSENIGAVARVMKNFNFKDLIIVNPKCEINIKTKIVSKHAYDIVKKARITKEIPYKKFDYIIGTTAKIGTDYNIIRAPLTPEEAAKKIFKTKRKIAILLGREGTGLTNKELEKCDFTITIPTSTYKTMNVSHALAIILYEIYKKKFKHYERITPVSKTEKEVILKKIKKILNKLQFSTKAKKETQIKVWRRIIGKAMLTKREAFALLGFLTKTSEQIRKK